MSVIDRCATLRTLLQTGVAHDANGHERPVHSNVSVRYAEALYRTVLEREPEVVLEIGMAFGISSLSILTALDEAGASGRLITIDPNQTTHWHGCGLEAVRRSGHADRHQLIERPDYEALPALLESNLRVELAYIDGWHTFDYTLLDFWYIDRMLRVGGIVGFNDCGFLAVNKVIDFVISHRRYVEIDVGLQAELGPGYSAATRGPRSRGPLGRRLGRRSRTFVLKQDRYFRKAESWEPNWDFFAEF